MRKNTKYIFESHRFEIIDCKDNTCKIKFNEETGEAFKKDRRKIYIIQNAQSILYVGEANCSIKERFRRSCNSFNHYARTEKARGGYKGYKWLNNALNSKRSLMVSIAIFNPLFDDDGKRSFIEAIEGELVFLIRNEFGYWPKFQNEIHFQNEAGAKEIALKIFNEIQPSRLSR